MVENNCQCIGCIKVKLEFVLMKCVLFVQAERLSRLVEVYRQNFEANFLDQYETCHRLETNKIRNVAKFYGHLLASDAISWEVGRRSEAFQELLIFLLL